MTADPTIEEWLEQGFDLGYCSEPVCATHGAIPSTEEEAQEWDEGHDPCEVVVRIW